MPSTSLGCDSGASLGSSSTQDASVKSPASWPSADFVASLPPLNAPRGVPFNATSQVTPGMHACITGLRQRHELNGVTVEILHNIEDADGADNRWMVLSMMAAGSSLLSGL